MISSINKIGRIPVIASDIDGVLLAGMKIINGVEPALKLLIQQKIPIFLITNGGGKLQSQKASQINSKFNINYFSHLNTILNYTSMRQIMNQKYSDKITLIGGSLKIEEVAADCGLRKFTNIMKLTAAFPQDFIHLKNSKRFQRSQSLIQIQQKLGLKPFDFGLEYFYRETQAIFLLNDLYNIQEHLQIILNLFRYKLQHNLQLPQFYSAQNDILFQSSFKLPRLGFGIFNILLKKTLKNKLNVDLNINYSGKPQVGPFKIVHQRVKRLGIQVSNFYMIGDNPSSDIEGANRVGWNSILTRTGIYKHGGHRAKYEVYDFMEAVKLILMKEGIKQ